MEDYEKKYKRAMKICEILLAKNRILFVDASDMFREFYTPEHPMWQKYNKD